MSEPFNKKNNRSSPTILQLDNLTTVDVEPINQSSPNNEEVEEDNSQYVHNISMLIAKITLVINLINIIYDIVMLSMTNPINLLGIDILQTMINIAGNIIFAISTVIAALYGSRTLKHTTKLSIIQEITHRYKQSDLKIEALRINELMETITVDHSNPLYNTVHQYREALRKHLIGRMGLSGAINIILALFLYFNLLIYFIVYSGWNDISPRSIRLLYFSMNVINPIICTVFSYIVVLCDNFNSTVEYTLRVNQGITNQSYRVIDVISYIDDLRERVERPLYKQLFD